MVSIIAICLGIYPTNWVNRMKENDFLPKLALHYHVLDVHPYPHHMSKPTHYPIETMYDTYPF